MRRETRAQFRIVNLVDEVIAGDLLDLGDYPSIAIEAQGSQLVNPIERFTERAPVAGQVRKQPTLTGSDRAIEFGDDPGRRALEHVKRAGFRGNLRHKLDGARAGSDHGYALASQVAIAAPGGGMEGDPGECLKPGKAGPCGD